jgi:NCAIR mutase (PurE)-related protein
MSRRAKKQILIFCPGGVGVVNIDNGFGAAYLAFLINHL